LTRTSHKHLQNHDSYNIKVKEAGYTVISSKCKAADRMLDLMGVLVPVLPIFKVFSIIKFQEGYFQQGRRMNQQQVFFQVLKLSIKLNLSI